MDIERNVRQAVQDIDNVLANGTFCVDPDSAVQRVQAPKATRRDFIRHFSKWENFKVLFGAAYSWLALDVGILPLYRVA
jgi:MFS transporter, PHS family, inorganic phosphate transporter